VTRALLESEGIPAYLTNEHLIGVSWPMSQTFGGVRLVVRSEHAEMAKEMLALRDSGKLQAALLEQFPTDLRACSKCGAAEFSERRDWTSVILAVVLLLACRVTFPPIKICACKSCGAIE
jgi:hypothetical protein